MNQDNSSETRSVPARVNKTNVFTSVVWIIPLVALVAGGWLLMKQIRETGPRITLLMDSAEGIEVNNTVVKVLNVDVGRVIRIKLRDDRKGVEVTAQLNADAKELMRSDTQFWVVKPRIDQSGVTGLNTLLSGSYIAFTPGKSSEEKHTFEVQDIPPIAAIGQSGLRLKLTGKNDKILNVGSPVLYENFMVGMIESARFEPADQTVHYTVFIQSPNDKLINSNSRFWLSSGFHIETSANGIKVDSAPLGALISGAISFDAPKTGDSHAVKNNDQFTLYDSQSEVANLPDGRSIYYTAFFKQSVRGLTAGSPVEYKGINIGVVTDVPYFDRNDSLHLFENGWIPVRLRLEPARMEINADAQSKDVWKQQFQTALDKGLTATISSNNLITGTKMVELTEPRGSSPKLKPHTVYGGDTVIATQTGGLDDLQVQVANLLEKFNSLPLDKTVNNLNGSLAELKTTLKSADAALKSVNSLVGKPQTQNLPAELNATLRELRETLKGVSPQSPVYSDVQSTLQSLDKTLKDAQPVIQTLKEKPNALIFNQNAKDPIPKGSR
ncbi:paraquat-inducible protein B [Neisseria chenwenguii]|uniref:Paraquat-inducible protein B n=1 Tax=Neisseria chenwenguii TaxID=1853278 RepID=A0A220S4B6_9NEIS|nr:intermembrane transport protein PqiB [Neisseria chenwenguii]ASK28344.1 paraquat-inducible protein B [Neisseria chenwenguii]